MRRDYYDSAAKPRVFDDIFTALWEYRDLLVLLVKRDLTSRYRRSFLGLLWSLLNPILTSFVLWLVFVHIFKAKLEGNTQFAPYLLSGVLVISFFIVGFNQAADSIASGAGIIQKIYVPPQVFAFSSAIVSAINFVLGLIPLLAVSLLTGQSLAFTLPFSIIFIFFMAFFIVGLGLITAILYIRFDDTRYIISVLLSLLSYLTPVFYPIGILSDRVRFLVMLNPLTSYLDIFRSLFFGMGHPGYLQWLYMAGSSIFFLLLGIRTFSRAWARTVVMM